MSNVLIGIIGVILFIGLALAGALFLGPRFQEATINSKASAIAQSVSQASSAANMFATSEGSYPVTTPNIGTQLVAKGYLKSVPANAILPAYGPAIETDDGNMDGTKAGTVVLMYLGNDPGSTADSVCLALAKQSGQVAASATATPSGSTIPSIPQGCFRMTGATIGSIYQNSYYAFARI